MHHEVDALVLNIRECGVLQILHHMGRHPEDAADLIYAELACGEELAVFRRQGDGLVGHALFQHRNLVGVIGTAINIGPVFTNLLRILQHTRMLQHAARLCAVLKESAAVFLHSQRGAETVFHHGDRRKADQPIEAETGDVEDLVSAEVDILVLLSRHLIGVGVIDVIDLALLIAIRLHVLRQQRIQRHDVVPAVPDDLGIGITPQKQMRHHGFPEGEARHLRIGLPVEQLIQRMVLGPLFILFRFIGEAVQMQREPGHRLGQQSDAGIDRGNLHGGLFIYLLAGVRFAENKGLPGIADAVRHRRSVSRADTEPVKKSHSHSSKKERTSRSAGKPSRTFS